MKPIRAWIRPASNAAISRCGRRVRQVGERLGRHPGAHLADLATSCTNTSAGFGMPGCMAQSALRDPVRVIDGERPRPEPCG